MPSEIVTAGVLVIGDEILSGRTADTNSGYLAGFFTGLGIDLREIRVVGDRQETIADAVNALRAIYDIVFTTGGIGPTHDDITADAVGVAFGLPVKEDSMATGLLRSFYGEDGLTPARRRMARIPEGAALIPNPISAAPGFIVGNVHVLAGVPSIMRAMAAELRPSLRHGELVESRSVMAPLPESSIAAALAAIQANFPDVAIGSYPGKRDDGGHRVEIVIRSRNQAAGAAAEAAVWRMLEASGIDLPD